MISRINCPAHLVTKVGRRIEIRSLIACLFTLGLDPRTYTGPET